MELASEQRRHGCLLRAARGRHVEQRLRSRQVQAVGHASIVHGGRRRMRGCGREENGDAAGQERQAARLSRQLNSY